MRYQDQINSMKACTEMLDSVGYDGAALQGLARCIAAFEEGDKDRAILEYRQIIGTAHNFASAIPDLDTNKFSTEASAQYFSRVLAVMASMCMLMGGEVR